MNWDIPSSMAPTFDDFIEAMGSLVANEYVPTSIVMHPKAWAELSDISIGCEPSKGKIPEVDAIEKELTDIRKRLE